MTQDQVVAKIGIVMIIDDEVIDQKMYKRIIERTGLVEEVMGFTAADRALEFLIGDRLA